MPLKCRSRNAAPNTRRTILEGVGARAIGRMSRRVTDWMVQLHKANPPDVTHGNHPRLFSLIRTCQCLAVPQQL
jgi:hypothetical protein